MGLFSRFQVYKRYHTISLHFLDRKEPQIEFPLPLRDRRCSSSNGSKTNGGLLLHGVEMEVETEMDSQSSEFKPIDHPLEPPDEDHPVQCPIPHSSLLNKDGGIRNEQLAENLWKSELPLAVNDEGMAVVATEPPTRAVRKRHHTLTGDHTVPPLLRSLSLPPPLPPTQSTTTCRVLRQL